MSQWIRLSRLSFCHNPLAISTIHFCHSFLFRFSVTLAYRYPMHAFSLWHFSHIKQNSFQSKRWNFNIFSSSSKGPLQCIVPMTLLSQYFANNTTIVSNYCGSFAAYSLALFVLLTLLWQYHCHCHFSVTVFSICDIPLTVIRYMLYCCTI